MLEETELVNREVGVEGFISVLWLSFVRVPLFTRRGNAVSARQS